jgi:hypothetical protein
MFNSLFFCIKAVQMRAERKKDEEVETRRKNNELEKKKKRAH